MVVNSRTREINQSTYKLIRISMLIYIYIYIYATHINVSMNNFSNRSLNQRLFVTKG